ncbi:MAG TPA: 50S ribosomal protein L6 [Clostridia bacterium]|nr:50S ribosomal protein L6 [Clostridia bacterium]
MSRIGKLPVNIPKGVQVSIGADNTVTIKGPKGTLSKKLHKDMIIKSEGNRITVERSGEEKEHKALHGLTRSLINNMVIGVTDGFSKSLEINGTGYRAQKNGNALVLNVGYSHPVEIAAPEGITYEVPAPNKVVVKGIDKQLVGEMAAEIRAVRKAEPYLGKGIKYDTEVIRRKEGKTGK